MKTLKCDICDHKESAETFEAWMEAMKPHYRQAHADVMQKNMHLNDEEKKSEMIKWMDENRKRFDSE